MDSRAGRKDELEHEEFHRVARLIKMEPRTTSRVARLIETKPRTTSKEAAKRERVTCDDSGQVRAHLADAAHESVQRHGCAHKTRSCTNNKNDPVYSGRGGFDWRARVMWMSTSHVAVGFPFGINWEITPHHRHYLASSVLMWTSTSHVCCWLFVWNELGDHTTPSSLFGIECTDVDVNISCCCWLSVWDCDTLLFSSQLGKHFRHSVSRPSISRGSKCTQQDW